MFNPYVKAIILAILAGIGVLATSIDDGTISTSEVVIAIAAVIAGLGTVWASPEYKWIIGGVVAGLTSLGAALLEGGVSLQEGITIAVIVVTALAAIYSDEATPNTPATNDPDPLHDSTMAARAAAVTR